MNEFLVVDDSAAVRANLKAAITNAHPSANVLEAATAKEAISAMKDGTARIVFLDIMLTDQGGGLQVAQKLLDKSPETRIIITTGLSRDHPEVVEVINLGAFSYLQKPFRKQAVMEIFDEIDSEENRLNRIR